MNFVFFYYFPIVATSCRVLREEAARREADEATGFQLEKGLVLQKEKSQHLAADDEGFEAENPF